MRGWSEWKDVWKMVRNAMEGAWHTRSQDFWLRGAQTTKKVFNVRFMTFDWGGGAKCSWSTISDWGGRGATRNLDSEWSKQTKVFTDRRADFVPKIRWRPQKKGRHGTNLIPAPCPPPPWLRLWCMGGRPFIKSVFWKKNIENHATSLFSKHQLCLILISIALNKIYI